MHSLFLHLGWAAVIANLDDITSAFSNRSENIQTTFNQHVELRNQFQAILERYLFFIAADIKICFWSVLCSWYFRNFFPRKIYHCSFSYCIFSSITILFIFFVLFVSYILSFTQDVDILSKIPLLPALLDKEETVTEDVPSNLFKWIAAKDNQASVEQLADTCKKGLEQVSWVYWIYCSVQDLYYRYSRNRYSELHRLYTTFTSFFLEMHLFVGSYVFSWDGNVHVGIGSRSCSTKSIWFLWNVFLLFFFQFSDSLLETIKAEVTSVLDAASKSELREIKGLEERYYYYH